jgi:hypothetical protein
VRSRSIASDSVRPSRASGCRRRVSEKRRSRAAAFEVEHAALDAALAQALDVLGQGGERRAARVDAERHPFVAVGGEQLGDLQQQRRRQVVDAVVAAVFQDVQRDRLAGP